MKIKVSSEEKLSVYNEGYRAFFFGVVLQSNPYAGLLAEQWEDGWLDAEDDCAA